MYSHESGELFGKPVEIQQQNQHCLERRDIQSILYTWFDADLTSVENKFSSFRQTFSYNHQVLQGRAGEG